ncbi:MAG: AMP-binding protein [Candidatus Cloacimonetes bacterium]|nr:AMP-binding protein [Candidatus Cloacimonadota bacterium]
MLKQIVHHLQSSQNTAFVINDTAYSYKELGTIASKYYTFILQHPEIDICGIAMHNDIETYAFMTAVILSNCGYVMLNLANPPERNAVIAEEAGLKHIVSSVAGDENIVPPFIAFTHLDAIPEPLGQVYFTEPVPCSTAYILFTSGSTGKPKGVRITKKNLNAMLDSFAKLPIPINETDKVLQMFDLTFDGSVLMLFMPLCAGASIYTVDTDTIKYMDIARLMVSYPLSYVFVVPSVIALLQPFMSLLHLPSVKTFIVGAEAATKARLDTIIPSLPNASIWNLYGPTEATVCVMAYCLDKNIDSELHNGLIPIGKPMQGNHSMIMDDGKVITDCDVKGELYIGGDQLTDGYVNDEEKNLTAFAYHDWKGSLMRFYATGDIVFLNSYGNYMYCGRKDRQVKIQGNRIELAEIEYHARKITHTEAIAILKETNGNPCLHLVVEGFSGDKDAVIQYLGRQLPACMIPQSITSIDKFPLTDSDKTDFKKLYELIP